MIVYFHPRCSTCKKALSFLEKRNKKISLVDITKQAPTLEELQTMLHYQNGNLKKLFNTSGQLYRELHLSDKIENMPKNEALKLLSENGMLVKRPFLIDKDFGLIGFNEDQWVKIL